jgi:hypothetical protein
MEIVYVLSNPAMKGIVKIGFTSDNDVNRRMGSLYGSGVPLPFKLEFACRVPNGREVERALHVAFNPHRVNPSREFFEIEPEQAIGILRLLHEDEITQEIEQQEPDLPPSEVAAAENYRKRRPVMNFEEMGIPVGAMLSWVHGPESVTVRGPRWVTYKGEESSLSAATKDLLGVAYAVNPGPFWTYQGRTISQIYNDTY